ncbi:MAG: 50S ribosomal protein L23 [Patescibacteria group bacterium]|nr:50S ribosomal protein L23 [Patescibacteria group bacterium]
MGLLDRWHKKSQAEKLNQSAAKAVEKKEAAANQAEPELSTKKSAPTIQEIAGKTGRKISALTSRIIIKPLVTEKAAVAESLNKYSFYVADNASKTQIKMAVEELYGVAPTAVNVLNTEGKATRFGRFAGRRSGYKKALVTLPPGKTISIHEGV